MGCGFELDGDGAVLDRGGRRREKRVWANAGFGFINIQLPVLVG